MANACFNNAVGVSNPGTIPDNQMTASSQRGNSQGASYGRLDGSRNNDEGWCAQSAGGTQDWLQVDLGKTIEICGTATLGNQSTITT